MLPLCLLFRNTVGSPAQDTQLALPMDEESFFFFFSFKTRYLISGQHCRTETGFTKLGTATVLSESIIVTDHCWLQLS